MPCANCHFWITEKAFEILVYLKQEKYVIVKMQQIFNFLLCKGNKYCRK